MHRALPARLLCLFGALIARGGALVATVQPHIALHRGFVDIYSVPDSYVRLRDVVTGERYTLDIFMDQTDQYDYLLQRCTYNGKFHFIDPNSCLVCDNFFQKKWENDRYGFPDSTKRTIVHFVAPEPMIGVECRVKIIQCCRCAERACERNVHPLIVQLPQQVININLSEPPVIAYAGASLWPWWIWLLIALAALLLLCALLLLALLCCRRRRKLAAQGKEVSAAKEPLPPAVAQPTIVSVEDNGGGSGKPSDAHKGDLPPTTTVKQRVYRTPSETPTESAHSSVSQSKSALMIRQQPRQLPEAAQPVVRGAANEHVADKYSYRTRERRYEIRNREETVDDDDEVARGFHKGQRESASRHEERATRQVRSNEFEGASYGEEDQTPHRLHSDRFDDRRREENAAFQDMHRRQLRERRLEEGTLFYDERSAQPASESIPAGEEEVYRIHQRNASQERFFKRSDHQKGIREEGFDKAQYSYTANHYADSESA